MNYRLLTGPLAGEIVSEGFTLGKFENLDEDMKDRVLLFGIENPTEHTDLDDLTQRYVNSWQDQETEEDPTLQ